MLIYRGETFTNTITANNFLFENGDIIKIGVKSKSNPKSFVLLDVHNFDTTAGSYTFCFSDSETANIQPADNYIFEVKIKHNDIKKVALSVQLVVEDSIFAEEEETEEEEENG